MKVILDNVIFSLQQSGGISVYWYHLIKQLMASENVDLSYIEENRAFNNIFRNKLSLEKATSIKANSLSFFGRYMNLNLSKLNDKAIFHSSYYRISKKPNHLNITTLHDFTYEYFNSGLRLMVHSYQKKRAILGSNGIICISENTKKDLLKFIPQAAERKIKVIPNGVDKIFRKLPLDSFEGANIPFPIFSYNIYVGDRSSSYKNFNMAVESSKLTNRPLAIVGGGKITSKETVLLEKELESSGYHHFNNVDTERLNLLYNFAFCLLYPSIYEGFGIPPIEAQKAGCPVVAFNASSIPEVVGPSGVLVEKNTREAFENAIKSLEHEDFRKEIIAKGYKNAERYSWEQTFKETMAFYKEIIEEKLETP